MKTKYISIEGCDGSGKTSLVKNLNNFFIKKGLKTLLTKEFGSQHNEFCSKLRDFALSNKFDIDETAGQLLFSAIIRQHQEKVIKPCLLNNTCDIIVSDRGPYSNYAYGPVHGIDEYFIETLFNLVYKGSKWPNLSIFINLPPEVAQKRILNRSPELFKDGGIDRIEEKGIEFQKKVRDNFIKLSLTDSRLVILNIDETMSEQDVLDKTVALISKKFCLYL